MFHYFWSLSKTHLNHSVANKTLGKKSQDAKLIKCKQLWLKALVREKMTRDPSWDPSHPIPEVSQWEKCSEASEHHFLELETYVGYSVSCSTWRAKCIHLFKEISAHDLISVIYTMKWLIVQRPQFHSAAKHWQFQGTWGQPSSLCCERRTRQTVRMDPNSCRGIHWWTNSCFVSSKIGDSVLKGSNRGP